MQTTSRSDRVAELMNRATESLRDGDRVNAMLCMRQALALRPGEAKAHRMVGQIYKLMGKDLLAQRSFYMADSLDRPPSAPVETDTQPQEPTAPGRPAAPATEPGQPAARPAARDMPIPRDQDDFDLGAEVAAEPVELSHSQERLVLDLALQCLAQVAATEKLMEEQGMGGREAFATVHEVREQLGDRVHQARDAWRAEQKAQAAPLAQELPAGRRYQGIGPFAHTLGIGQGAVAEGAEVANLQKLLNLEGLHVQVTGKYDTTTTLAVRKFQETYRLTQRSGLVGGETRRLLNRLVGQR